MPVLIFIVFPPDYWIPFCFKVPFTSKEGRDNFIDWLNRKDEEAKAARETAEDEAAAEEPTALITGRSFIAALQERCQANCPFTEILLEARKVFAVKTAQPAQRSSKQRQNMLLPGYVVSKKEFLHGMHTLDPNFTVHGQGKLYSDIAGADGKLKYTDLEFFLISVQAMDLNDEVDDWEEGETDRKQEAAAREYLASQLLRRIGAGRRPFGDVLLRSKQVFFDRFDTDQDGVISADEWKIALDRINANLTKEQQLALFELMDEDDSGSVDYLEFEKLLVRCCHGIATNDAVVNKQNLQIGDILRVPSNVENASVQVTWANDCDIDLGMTLFDKDHKTICSCFYERPSPAEARKALVLDRTYGTRSQAIHMKLSKIPAKTMYAIIYLGCRDHTYDGVEGVELKLLEGKTSAIGGFTVSGKEASSLCKKRGMQLAILKRVSSQEWGFTYWPDVADRLPGVPMVSRTSSDIYSP